MNFSSTSLPLNDTALLSLKSTPFLERQIISNAGILYDSLADAVDEINSVF